MISFGTYMTEKRKASDVTSGDISLFIMSMQNLVNKYKRSQIKAADIYVDVVMKGKFVDRLETNVEPIWEKYGYPEIGVKAWGDMEKEVIQKFLMGK